MAPTPLNYHQVKAVLRGDAFPNIGEKVMDVEQSLRYHQKRLNDITAAIDGVLNPGRTKARFRKFLPRSSRARPSQLSLEELRVSQGHSKAIVAALQSLQSPLRRLPPELLTEIFIHCLPCAQFIQPNRKEAPLLLTQVCAWWRRVCISSPKLWTSLELVTKISEDKERDEDRQHVANTESLLRLWLSRSGDCPLSISIQNDSILIQDAQNALDNCAPRLQHLKVTIPKKTHPSILPNNQYPLLKSFELNTPCGLTDTLIDDLSCAMMRSPMLHRFIWNNTSYISSQINLHWSNLTHLQLTTTITLEQCLTILSMAINATHLDFRDISLNSIVPPYSNITLPKLSSLTISSRHNIATIFELITLPNLKAFMVHIPAGWPHPSLLGLFRRSRFPLQNLGIFFPHLTEAHLTECLDLVHNTLTELTIQHFQHADQIATVTDALLDRLTVTDAGEIFCPRLEAIAFYRCISCSPGRYAKMVRSRLMPANTSSASPQRRGVSLLKGVEAFQSEVELSSLKPLRELGLQLTVYSEDGELTVDIDLDESNGMMDVDEGASVV